MDEKHLNVENGLAFYLGQYLENDLKSTYFSFQAATFGDKNKNENRG